MDRQQGWIPAVFRNRDFSVFFAGQAISRLGDSMFTIAIVWLMHELTNSSLWMSVALAAGFVPHVVIAPVSGVLVNRWPKRRVVIRTDVLRFLLLAALTAATAAHHTAPWMLVVANLLLATASTFATPAYIVVQKRIVHDHHLMQANSVNQTALNITQIIGYAAGGTLIGLLGAAAAFAIDAVSFLCAVAAMLLIRVSEPAVERKPLTGMNLLRDIAQGVRIAARFPLVRLLTPVILSYTFFVIAVENLLLVQYIANTLHRGSAAVGAVNATMAVGELVGSLLVTSVTRRIAVQRLLIINMLVTSVCVGLTGIAPGVAVICALFGISGFCMSMVNITFFTSIQQVIPSESLAAVWGMVAAVFNAVVPVGQLVFGAIGLAVAPGRLIVILGLCAALCAAAPVWSPALRRQLRDARPTDAGPAP
ncbi:MFS transporter [Alicyclobacillus macrosporangiidus]|uniref:Predicted arabinose efflux permease, MFS family n=1 Tax=Alicyclobacillus macrosporangiidus TaxID=392015 RepID=A0A1I7JPH3_9BACL|nr:MFS transporter [Alicyclobacillus macrosporangiidus]SFU87077.1 Predicted arabinose efflux permease, MFS family [Alicyclobacillus macrosporangiidus]